jgi:hypothetical protein
MQTITLPKVANASTFKNKAVSYKDYDRIIRDDSFIHLDGNLPMVYISLKGILPKGFIELLNDIQFQQSTRANGLISTEQILFSKVPRNHRKDDYCRDGALEYNNPHAAQLLYTFAQELSRKFQELMPYQFKLGSRLLAMPGNQIRPEYMIKGTLFTSGILNKNNALGYHYDRSNMKHLLSCLFVIKRGVAGGLLSLPEYKTAIECSNESLLIFHGREILHGVSQIVPDTGILNAYRYSIVLYTLSKMKECLGHEGELSRIQEMLEKKTKHK